jgi:hypothetical protein
MTTTISSRRHICDEKTCFVTDAQMWRQFCDQMNIVTRSSQMTTCDHFGAFGDFKGTSLMTTSLLVTHNLLTKEQSITDLCQELIMVTELRIHCSNLCWAGHKLNHIRGHVDITWIEGPTGKQTTSKPSGHWELTWGPTRQPPRKSTSRGGPTRGGLNRPCVSSS